MKMPRPKKIKDITYLSVALSKVQAERIKYMCIKMSTQLQRQITASEAIRMAIEAAYPVPKSQPDLFK